MRCAGYCGDPAGSIERIRGHPSELEWHQCRKHPQPLPEHLSAGRGDETERYSRDEGWGNTGKSIAITPCAAEHPMSFKVPDKLLTDGQCRMMINGIQFIQVLLEANGLAAGKDHQFKGRYDAEKNAVIISLEKDEQSALSPQKCTT